MDSVSGCFRKLEEIVRDPTEQPSNLQQIRRYQEQSQAIIQSDNKTIKQPGIELLAYVHYTPKYTDRALRTHQYIQTESVDLPASNQAINATTTTPMHSHVEPADTTPVKVEQSSKKQMYTLSIQSNQYSTLGESEESELRFLRQKLEQTEKRLNEQNHYLREHIRSLHTTISDLNQEVDEGIENGQKLKQQCAVLKKEIGAMKLVTVEKPNNIFSSSRIKQSEFKVQNSEEYKSLVKEYNHLQIGYRSILQSRQQIQQLLAEKQLEITNFKQYAQSLLQQIETQKKQFADMDMCIAELRQRNEMLEDGRNVEMRAVIGDLGNPSFVKKLSDENEQLLKQVKLLSEENTQLDEANQVAQKSLQKLQETITENELIRSQLEESRKLLQLMRQEKQIIEKQYNQENRIKDEIIQELQKSQNDILIRNKTMESRIIEQDKIIKKVTALRNQNQLISSPTAQLESYKTLTKTLSGQNVRLKEELRRVKSGDGFGIVANMAIENSKLESEEDVCEVSINSQRGSQYVQKKPNISLSEMQRRINIINEAKNFKNSQNSALIDISEEMFRELELLQAKNSQLAASIDKAKVSERQLAKSNTKLVAEDQILFERVIKQLEKQKQANQDLSEDVDNLSKELLKAQRQIFKKSERINYLNMALVNRSEIAYTQSREDVENLKKYLHHTLDDHKKSKSNIFDERSPSHYKGKLQMISRHIQESDTESLRNRGNRAISTQLQSKLKVYSNNVVPELERQLEKYKRLYDDALFALKEKDAEAKQLNSDLVILKNKFIKFQKSTLRHPSNRLFDSHMYNSSGSYIPSRIESVEIAPINRIRLSQLLKCTQVSPYTMLIIMHRLCELCFKMARNNNYPIIKLDSIYVIDYDEPDPSRLKLKLVDLDSTSRVLSVMKANPATSKYFAPEAFKQGSIITLQSIVWNLGVILDEMLEHRKCYDFPISNRRIDAQTEELQLKALEDIRTSLKAESPSNRESLGRLIFRIEQEMQKYEPLIRPTPS